jgi:cell division protein ZapA (FtsZ GTPase activity inhibitor)
MPTGDDTTPNRTHVDLGGYRIPVETQGDESRTLDIARRVNDELARIEADSDRIDTHRFALEAAFNFAALLAGLERRRETELEESAAKQSWERQQLIRELAGINEAIARIIEGGRPG